MNIYLVLSGNLSVTDPEVVIQQPSLFSQYRPVDVTMYDLIYGRWSTYYHSILVQCKLCHYFQLKKNNFLQVVIVQVHLPGLATSSTDHFTQIFMEEAELEQCTSKLQNVPHMILLVQWLSASNHTKIPLLSRI